MTGLDKNRANGTDVETYVAGKVGGHLFEKSIFPFDVYNAESVFEVKSAYFRTKSGHVKKDGSPTMKVGRFLICVNSHKRFLDEANGQGKSPFYYFVLKDWDTSLNQWLPIAEKKLSWAEVDQLLSKGRLFHRYDNVDFVVLRYVLIFPKVGASK